MLDMKSKHARSAAYYYPYIHPYHTTAALSAVASVPGSSSPRQQGLSHGLGQYWVTPPASYYEPQMPHVAPGKAPRRLLSLA